MRTLWGVTVLACLAAGCGSRPTGLENLVPVKGKVVFAGKPITAGNVRTVVLHADRGRGNTTAHEPRGEIDKDGNFAVYTANRAGAPPGHYRVTVSLMESPINSKNLYAPPKWLIDAKYGEPDTSGLNLHVVEDAVEGYELKIAN